MSEQFWESSADTESSESVTIRFGNVSVDNSNSGVVNSTSTSSSNVVSNTTITQGSNTTIIDNSYIDNSYTDNSYTDNSYTDNSYTDNSYIDNSYNSTTSVTIYYSGGNQVISGYTSGGKIILGTTPTGMFFSDGNFCVGSSTGALVVQNAADKVVDLSDAAGNDFVKAYAATNPGVIDGRGLAGFEIINGSNFGSDYIYAGDSGSQLWGGNGSSADVLTGGGGTDVFVGGKYQGSDIFMNTSSADVVILNDATLSDIVAAAEADGLIALSFNTGNTVAVQSSEQLSAAFVFADGSAYRFNHVTKSWQSA